jgi:hypothetical protein
VEHHTDPLTLRVDAVTDLHIDLGDEMLIAAEREGEKIAVEIKSFFWVSRQSMTFMQQLDNLLTTVMR